ncbi:carbohydrate kinase [Agreia sp. VKM Ac-1783]|uniref:carbohydrate kinase family protein n=1 Tax=Agreia sp. VKM Ac-1783 TaxID=1938889 RepID=UPI000A2AE125|nr:carbohydrate kinase [Agreia sp. VKM Ac-1783]SMQ68365.1 fructokinase [Agreia sp. VKM Ac-1783]
MSHPLTAVTAIGESLVDVIVGSDGVPSTEHPGGSPMNIALGLARLDRPVALVTHIGNDARGMSIATHLRDAGVTLAVGSIRDEPSSTATAYLAADGSARYVFDLRWSLPLGLCVDDPVLAGSELLHVGSIGAFLEPGGSTVVSLLKQLADSDRPPLICFDPNMRPSIVTDHDAALARFEQIAALAAVVKLSDEDAEWLYPELGLEAAIEHILRLGVGLVTLTLGSAGALLATRSLRVTVPGVAVVVADTIGAGDSFMSALIDFVARLLDEGVPSDALRNGLAFDAQLLTSIGEYAVRCAAITVSRPGANPPNRAEVGSISGDPLVS